MADHGSEAVARAERQITFHHIDEGWARHLSDIATVREGVHLVGLGGLEPLNEFRRQVGEAFETLLDDIDGRITETFETVRFSNNEPDLDDSGVRAPSSTWTYLVNDQAVGELREMLFGQGSYATGAGAALMTGPLILLWAVGERLKRRR